MMCNEYVAYLTARCSLKAVEEIVCAHMSEISFRVCIFVVYKKHFCIFAGRKDKKWTAF